jgi:hypothetical protein
MDGRGAGEGREAEGRENYGEGRKKGEEKGEEE